jgi:hypothetical protein
MSEIGRRAEESGPPLVTFAKDSLTLIATASAVYPEIALFSLGPRRGPQLGMVRELTRSTEAMRMGLSCLDAAVQAEPKVFDFVDTLTTYDIPSGQSPRAESDSLLKLIETGKKICLAPLVAGGSLGISQLGGSTYLQPVMTVATGAVMTLILVSTLSISDLVVRYLMQRRPHGPENQQQHRG